MIGRRSLELKTAPQLLAMQRAGVVLSEALDATLAAAAPGVTTAELDAVFAGVLAESSNVGTIMVGENLTPEQRYDYLRAFGIGEQ